LEGLATLTILKVLNSNRFSGAEIVLTFFALVLVQQATAADNDDSPATTNSWTPQNSRFGLFGWLDHRSGYYQDSFPQALTVDDTSLEPGGELELTYLHTAAGWQHSDQMSAELQKSIGLVTFELEVPYQRLFEPDGMAKGVGNIELHARCPFYQYVSDQAFFDDTLGVIGGVGIPVYSPVSRNTELEGGLFNDAKLGRHFTLQTILEYDQLFGEGDEGGAEEFDYGVVLGWSVSHEELPIPGIAKLTPLLELDGDLGLNLDEAGQNSLLGSLGFRADFCSVLGLEPSLALSYVFPMSSAARDEVHWGIATNVTIGF
jgi:hypothetical protein